MSRQPDRSTASAERVFAAIRNALEMNPSLRVGQIIANAFGADPFYIENDELARYVNDYAGVPHSDAKGER